ncbi:MAG: PorT family protein [Bacteroidales bacterium]|nr:PorT family protein [Bacteroidales bacterium]
MIRRVVIFMLFLTVVSAVSASAGNRKTKKAVAEADTVSTVDTILVGGHELVLENVATDEVKYTREFLDTVQIKKKFIINDYTMIGFQYGVGLNRMAFNPSMGQSWLFTPTNIGITYTRYGKIFGYMPYFGLQIGLFYGQEGYKLDEGYFVQQANLVTMDIVELTALAHMHFDFWKMKFIINLGPYVSYRLSIHRESDYYTLPPALVDNFLSSDRRWDYGIKGGGGLGLIFDPIEIHLQVMYKFGFGLLYDPDYNSEYYYRFATVSNLIFSIGVHFQLTKRTGRSTHQLRKDARQVYNERKYGIDEPED